MSQHKKTWIKYVLLGTLVSFVLLDLLIVVSGTRVLARALQPVPASDAASAHEIVCDYFTGLGFDRITLHTVDGGQRACPLLLPAPIPAP
jgi:hypothetical protein